MHKEFLTIMDLIRTHHNIYPRMQIQDVYKLLYQSAMGAEHLLNDTEKAKSWFFQEYENAARPFPDERLYDPVSLNGNIIRLNFRVARQKIVASMLWDAFLKSVKAFNADIDTLADYWQQFLDMIKKENFDFSIEDARVFHAKVKGSFPVMHHSSIYRECYNPSYRIINIDILKECGVLHE